MSAADENCLRYRTPLYLAPAGSVSSVCPVTGATVCTEFLKSTFSSSRNRCRRKSGNSKTSSDWCMFRIQACFRKVASGNLKRGKTGGKAREWFRVVLVVHIAPAFGCGNGGASSGKCSRKCRRRGDRAVTVSTVPAFSTVPTEPNRDVESRGIICGLKVPEKE